MKSTFTLAFFFAAILLNADDNKIFSLWVYKSISTSEAFPLNSLYSEDFKIDNLVKSSFGLVNKEEISKEKPVGIAMSARKNSTGYPSGIFLIPLKDKIKLDLLNRFPKGLKVTETNGQYLVKNKLGVRQLEDYLLFGLDPESLKSFEIANVKNLFASSKASFIIKSDLKTLTENEKVDVGKIASFGDSLFIEAESKEKEILFKINSSLDLRTESKVAIMPPKNYSSLNVRISEPKLLDLLYSLGEPFNDELKEQIKTILSGNILFATKDNNFFTAVYQPDKEEQKKVLKLTESVPAELDVFIKNDFLFVFKRGMDKTEIPDLIVQKHEEDFVKGEIDLKFLSLAGIPNQIQRLIFDLKVDKSLHGTVKLILK